MAIRDSVGNRRGVALDRAASIRTIIAAGVFIGLLSTTFDADANSVRLTIDINNAPTIDESKSGTSLSNAVNYSINGVAGRVEGRVFRSGDVGAKATVTGTVPALFRSIASSQTEYRLTPPAGASVAGGTLVLYAALAGETLGNAVMSLSVDVAATTPQWQASGRGERSIADQPGDEMVEFDIPVALPATMNASQSVTVTPSITLTASVGIAPSFQIQQSSAVGLNGGKITGFRMLDASGVQIAGFKLSGAGTTIPELGAPPAGQSQAVEYYNAAFAHYFVTADPDEIRKLDTGVTPGWQRTGESFNVYTAAGAGRAPVCRFFTTSFGARSSHFYAPRGLGCEGTLANPLWLFEGDVFHVALPDADGNCPANTVTVYRLYNNGEGGAPNHRFTTSEATRLAMVRDGYVAEGAGIGVGMCAPQ